MKKKIVLAFSGGLDTSFCIPWLKEQGYEVHTAFVNTGGFSSGEEEEIRKRAMELGAKSHTCSNIVELYYNKGIKYLIFGNVLKNATYPLSVSSERIFQGLEVLRTVNGKVRERGVSHDKSLAGTGSAALHDVRLFGLGKSTCRQTGEQKDKKGFTHIIDY